MPGSAQETLQLSQLLGRELVAEDGAPIGRIQDLTVKLQSVRPEVIRVVVRADRGSTHLLPCQPIGPVAGHAPIRVRVASTHPAVHGPLRDLALNADELLLGRDVMDTQVVDLNDCRLSRVSDLFLVHRPDGVLEVAAADVGMGGVLRRIGLGWFARHLAPVVVDWHDLHLTSNRGHEIQLSTSSAGFRRLDSQGLAELLTRLSTGKATDLIGTLPARHAAAAVHRSHPATGRRLIGALSHHDARRLITAARSEHAARLAELRAGQSAPAQRRFFRTAGWRINRPPAGHSVPHGRRPT